MQGTRNHGSRPDFGPWLGLGKKNALVMVRGEVLFSFKLVTINEIFVSHTSLCEGKITLPLNVFALAN